MQFSRASFQEKLYTLLPLLPQADGNTLRYQAAREGLSVLVSFNIEGGIEVLTQGESGVVRGAWLCTSQARAIAHTLLQITEGATSHED